MGSKFYTVYKTSNLVTGEYYIGLHETDNPDDSYLGSGSLLLKEIKKIGKKNFKKEVLFILDSVEKSSEKEAEVLEKSLGDPMCYNRIPGGIRNWVLSLSNQNKIWINNGFSEMRLRKNLALPKGWKFGRCFTPSRILAGKKIEEIMGVEKAAELRKKQSIAKKGKPGNRRGSKSLSRMKGMSHTEYYGSERALQISKNMSRAHTGKKLSQQHKVSIGITVSKIPNLSELRSESMKKVWEYRKANGLKVLRKAKTCV